MLQTDADLFSTGERSQSKALSQTGVAISLKRGRAPLLRVCANWQLGNTLHSWCEEIACMWRFTRNDGITEGFHTKMEVLQRQAHGLRNFQNYRLHVRVLCS